LKKIDRVVLISDALGEAVAGHVSQLDLLALADVVVKTDLNGGPEEYDRPLNVSNSNFYSMAVDTAFAQRSFAVAAREAAELDGLVCFDVDNSKRRFDEFCKQVAV
jgi:capsid portal protein